MKAGIISKDINGWPVIAKWLVINKKRQIDLAALLDVTASAISQIKSGNILLSAKQISLILDYLKIDSKDMCALYTLIFNARLHNNLDSTKKLIVNIADSNNKNDFFVSSNSKSYPPVNRDSFRRVPLMTFTQAISYEPALESIESFASCCSSQTVLFPDVQVGSFALLIDQKNTTPEFAHSAILLVSGDEYPVHGDMVVAKLRSGEVITKYYLRKDDIVHFKSQKTDADNFVWRYKEDPGYVQWMYPIIEICLKLRADNYELYD
jgi:SOS-response transcriptional repressor LexA